MTRRAEINERGQARDFLAELHEKDMDVQFGWALRMFTKQPALGKNKMIFNALQTHFTGEEIRELMQAVECGLNGRKDSPRRYGSKWQGEGLEGYPSHRLDGIINKLMFWVNQDKTILNPDIEIPHSAYKIGGGIGGELVLKSHMQREESIEVLDALIAAIGKKMGKYERMQDDLDLEVLKREAAWERHVGQICLGEAHPISAKAFEDNQVFDILNALRGQQFFVRVKLFNEGMNDEQILLEYFFKADYREIVKESAKKTFVGFYPSDMMFIRKLSPQDIERETRKRNPRRRLELE